MSTVRVVAAIDFGTYATGFAWAYKRRDRPLVPEAIQLYDSWPGAAVPYHKNLTALLLDEVGEVADWGYRAHNRHMQERDSQNTYHVRFKMGLLRESALAARAEARPDRPASGAQTPGYPPEFLVTQYLKAFCEHALNEVLTRSKVRADEILWCLTVPAIWRDQERRMMRSCAEQAGLPGSPERLLIAVEPEVAALYARQAGEAKLNEPGSRFMVVDAGGGTVDLTSYEVAPAGLTEIGLSTGGKHGATYSDAYLVDRILADRIGPEVLSTIVRNSPELLHKVSAQWELAKRTFDPEQTYPVVLDISSPMLRAISAAEGARSRLAKAQGGVDDQFVLTPKEVKQAFDHTIHPLLELVREQLKTVGPKSVSQILLVGGFAQSRYLQEQLRKAFDSRRMQVVVPTTPAAAILLGAVFYANDPTLIRGRTTKLTYGISFAEPFERGIDPESTLMIQYDGQELCSARFKAFVRAGDVVEPGTRVPVRAFPILAGQRSMGLKVVVTEEKTPRYVTDEGCRELGVIEIDMSKTLDLPPAERMIEINMVFGGTEVETVARDPRTGEEERLFIDFVEEDRL
ncbi:molecular chaperone DnaK (HSP70) [Catenulispora sp. EB89]|uniref:Hsp70 family protein n=1 Tax=Catenulispora sp. EB89 TaxID=3156257 RepID=UPI0035136C13